MFKHDFLFEAADHFLAEYREYHVGFRFISQFVSLCQDPVCQLASELVAVAAEFFIQSAFEQYVELHGDQLSFGEEGTILAHHESEIRFKVIVYYHYSFTDEAWTKYRTTLTQAYEVRDPETWGNARYITNLLDRIYMQHAARCVRQQPEDKFQLLTLTPDDIVPIETPRQRAKFGF